MNQQEVFNAITTLFPILQEYRRRGSAKMDADQKLLLRQVYLTIYPTATSMDLACPSCIIHYLSVLESYYEREYIRWIEAQLKMEAKQTQDAASTNPPATSKNGSRRKKKD
ncbi:hypothetical protein [Flaviaesturariibacter amylovorans]|uniref:DUF4290 domain-containing protein n=1 Tax=Flaviaesturariibacter amylovorans TaxID=1084520 RepID=A0ABP8GL87_9BACT